MKENNFAPRLEKIFNWMAEEGVALVMLQNTETRRDQNIRWLTGFPGDAMMFLSLDRKAILSAWDVNLAKLYAAQSGVIVVSYEDLDRKPVKALNLAAQKLGLPVGSRIDIPSVTPYPAFLDYVGELTDFDILCRDNGAGSALRKMRAVKDEEEIVIIRKAAEITNELIDLLVKNIQSGKIKSESDAALFIEAEARKRECEGTSFEVLAAGPDRSFAIHAFPTWTNAPFGGQGLSILDFGVKLGGYCTDVTLTFARDLDAKQEKLINLTEKAAKLALSMAHNGVRTREIAAAVDALFSKSKKKMPHSLGHGLGLQEHEFPEIRNSSENEWNLCAGMVFTLEPGLYDPIIGGCRLENDILITETGHEVLTTAGIVKLG